MNAFLFSLVTFACVSMGAMFGMLLGPRLPEQHTSSDSKDVVRLTMGLVATTVALVLGLLVASAKSFYDTQNSEVTQLAANMVLLDRVLVHYGPEAADARAVLRANAASASEILKPGGGFRHGGELIMDKIQELSPKNDNQTNMKMQASNLAIQTGQIRWLMFAQNSVPVPKILLLVLLFWLVVLFFSFGLFGPRNLTVKACLLVSALAVAGAIFLILEMYQPQSGFIRVSDAPLRAAVAQLGQ
jgi:hypothetical protein